MQLYYYTSLFMFTRCSIVRAVSLILSLFFVLTFLSLSLSHSQLEYTKKMHQINRAHFYYLQQHQQQHHLQNILKRHKRNCLQMNKRTAWAIQELWLMPLLLLQLVLLFFCCHSSSSSNNIRQQMLKTTQYKILWQFILTISVSCIVTKHRYTFNQVLNVGNYYFFY